MGERERAFILWWRRFLNLDRAWPLYGWPLTGWWPGRRRR